MVFPFLDIILYNAAGTSALGLLLLDFVCMLNYKNL